jgi:hypothetical protein
MRLVPLLVVALFGFLMPPGGRAAQVPAGFPYRPGVHPNPIVTFATDADFAPAAYGAARDTAGIELFGLSARVGSREDIAITESKVLEVELMDQKTDVLFFPAVRQRFRLTGERSVTLYSFRNPRPGDVPVEILSDVLNQHAFRRHPDPEDARFGPHPGPEELMIRGAGALLFEATGETPMTLFWHQDGVSHVVTGDGLEPEELFDVVKDFL